MAGIPMGGGGMSKIVYVLAPFAGVRHACRARRWRYFVQAWNIFDFSVLMPNAADTLVCDHRRSRYSRCAKLMRADHRTDAGPDPPTAP